MLASLLDALCDGRIESFVAGHPGSFSVQDEPVLLMLGCSESIDWLSHLFQSVLLSAGEESFWLEKREFLFCCLGGINFTFVSLTIVFAFRVKSRKCWPANCRPRPPYTVSPRRRRQFLWPAPVNRDNDFRRRLFRFRFSINHRF